MKIFHGGNQLATLFLECGIHQRFPLLHFLHEDPNRATRGGDDPRDGTTRSRSKVSGEAGGVSTPDSVL